MSWSHQFTIYLSVYLPEARVRSQGTWQVLLQPGSLSLATSSSTKLCASFLGHIFLKKQPWCESSFGHIELRRKKIHGVFGWSFFFFKWNYTVSQAWPQTIVSTLPSGYMFLKDIVDFLLEVAHSIKGLGHTFSHWTLILCAKDRQGPIGPFGQEGRS